MKSWIGFVLFLVGSAGIDGQQSIVSAVTLIIGLSILWKESRKIDAPTHHGKSVY